MQAELQILILSAITIACLHTATGPDHYLPFIALSKARGWSLQRTLFWTVVCGCGHVWSSIFLGLGGAAIGWSLSKISWLEGIRGGLAGWALLGFGLVYGIWGFIKAKRGIRHKHFDVNDDGSVFVYDHQHGEAVAPQKKYTVTPWVMFLIFVLGPCEPMIPLLYFPAAKNSFTGICILIIVYTVFTLATMLVIVALGYKGFSFFKTGGLEKHMHVLGGLTIFICGAGMIFLGW